MTNTPSIVQTAQPFLLAVCRMPGAIADDELETIIDWGRLDPNSGIEAISLVDEDAVDPASLDLSRYSGVIITGSPFGFGQDENRKSREHQVMERRILALSKRLVEEDVPTLGICFGLQAIVKALGGELVEGYGEDLQAPRMTLTPEAAADPLTADMPQVFYGYTGHAEAVGDVPGGGVVLATGDYCRVQMVRWGENVYGTQFHPEITREGMRIRINTYGDTYYPADERAAVIARCDAAEVDESNRLITKFVARYSS